MVVLDTSIKRENYSYPITFAYLHTKHSSSSTLWVVVSKKILKSAVGRNRIRRRIYEAIRLELPDFTYHQDCIFIVFSKTTMTMPFRELRALVHTLLNRSIHE